MTTKKKTKKTVKAKAKPRAKATAKRKAAAKPVVVKGSGCVFCDLNLEPYYTEITKGVGGFAHQTTKGPVKCTNPAKRDLPQSNAVWFGKDKKPRESGVYRTSRTDIVTLGSARSAWDGAKWGRHRDWGQYHDTFNFIWSGEGPDNLSPLKES